MSNYNDLIELRNRLLNDDLTVFEEDCQLLDRVLDDYEQKDQRIAELEKEKQTSVKEFIDFAIEKFSEVNDLGDFKYYLDNAEFKYVIKDLLKEKGIE